MENQSFHYVFQISKSIIFEVNYYRLGNNKNKYFTTSAAELNKYKTDFAQCGQAQKSLLPKNSIAYDFWSKYDKCHTQDVNNEVYVEIIKDLEGLKTKYNYIEKFSDTDFSFSQEKELSKLKLKN